jgi:tetrahydromethanopterin S-methyltransferase subunit H
MQVFLNDFSVYGDKEDHLGQLKKILENFKRNGISLNLTKCAFCVSSSVLLRHIVCNDGLLVGPIKNIVVTTMPILVNVTIVFFFRG